MGPNLQCPVHGTRENLFIGMTRLRDEVSKLEAEIRHWKELSESSSHPFTDPDRKNYQAR
jgi:hypothetical protein